MKFWKNTLFLILAFNLLTACDKEETDLNALINPADADALSAVLILPNGTSTSTGIPPSPSGNTAAPSITNSVASLSSSNGSTALLNFNYNNIQNNLGGCYVQIDGAGNFFTIPYDANSSNAGQLQLPLGIPTNVDAGEFDVVFCVYDDDGLVSNVVNTTVEVLRLGTGSLQVSLSWDNESDQDLYVIDPNGEQISYTNTSSQSGGELDRDDTNGFGPENIYWSENAPDGTYQVKVDDYSNSTNTNFYITVSSPSGSRNFQGVTSNGNTVEVITFVKSGEDLIF